MNFLFANLNISKTILIIVGKAINCNLDLQSVIYALDEYTIFLIGHLAI